MLTVLNQQPPEKPSYREDGFLQVFKVFPTIQGEGPFTGTPAIFARLSGCNLGAFSCSLCDTDYTSQRELLSSSELVDRIKQAAGPNRISLIVVTGGEPYRQNIIPFTKHAIREGFRVQVETNGTLCPPGMETLSSLSIVCSPKTPKINWDMERCVSAYKYVLDADFVDPDDGLPTCTMGASLRIARPAFKFSPEHLFIQPLDEQDEVENQRNRKAAVDSCLRFGYRLSLQTHKLLGLE